jgi:hypothetical protein
MHVIITMVFNTSATYFHKKIISIFKELFNDEIDLRVRYLNNEQQT